MGIFTATNAQFAVSVHLGGAYSNGTAAYNSTYYGYNVRYDDNAQLIITDTTYGNNSGPLNADVPIDVTGGIKIGYQTGRLQFGLAGRASWSYVSGDFTPDDYNQCNPNINPKDFINLNWEFDDLQGFYNQQQYSFAIAPYVRYELIQLGDVAFFLELDAFYSQSFKPKRHEFLDFYHKEMHHTHDDNKVVDRETSGFGAELIPGMSWQLSEHCNIDLYFDLLNLAYAQQSEKVTTVTKEWDVITEPNIISKINTVTTTTTTTTIGFATNGAPSISGLNRSWVRVGFNYTF